PLLGFGSSSRRVLALSEMIQSDSSSALTAASDLNELLRALSLPLVSSTMEAVRSTSGFRTFSIRKKIGSPLSWAELIVSISGESEGSHPELGHLVFSTLKVTFDAVPLSDASIASTSPYPSTI